MRSKNEAGKPRLGLSLAVLAGFGLKGVPLLLFNMILVIIASIVQAVVFTLLTTIYFALILVHEEEKTQQAP